ncbi:MAG TPA: IS110 family transposase [Acidobacteriaceae bacterium]|jgi:transposase|nr:IS110 family transposase [Acidobacteriaceae bacterium]
MKIIGCDFHTRQQRIAMLDKETGELVERQLWHENGEARTFYEQLAGPVRVGIEATGYTHWFEKMLAELGHELWVGDAAKIRASVVRKQKTDKRDAVHILELLVQDRFPRIWMPTAAERDLRQLVLHRVKLVQMRTKVMNQLHAMAMGQGLCRKKKLWSKAGRQELEALPLGPWASRRRQELLTMLEQMEKPIAELDRAVEQQAAGHSQAARLMTHPGVGPLTSLAFVLTIGEVERFRRSRQVSSYLGLDPRLNCSADRMRIGSISKQGSSTTRWLLVEAGQTAARKDAELRRLYQRLKFRRGSQIAKVAVARRLAVRLYWMLRSRADYRELVAQMVRLRGSSGSAVMEAVVHRDAE